MLVAPLRSLFGTQIGAVPPLFTMAAQRLLLSSMTDTTPDSVETPTNDSPLLRTLRATQARLGKALKPRAADGVYRVIDYVRRRRMRRPQANGKR